jgi:saccharopine dehydrogenase (NAD+, L-lysine-forming)
MAIDNLPSMLPLESSIDYAGQLLASLETLTDLTSGVWGRAEETFRTHMKDI